MYLEEKEDKVRLRSDEKILEVGFVRVSIWNELSKFSILDNQSD